MAKYAYLFSAIHCSTCHTLIIDQIPFQWGFCPGTLPRADHTYSLGDAIQWHRVAESTCSWTYFRRGGHEVDANIGDPSITNLIICASLHGSGSNLLCPGCDSVWGGIALRVQDGVIRHVWLYEPHEFSDDADIYLVNADETVRAMTEWTDRPMAVLDEDRYSA